MSVQFEIKRFNELSIGELYQLLQLRSEVFVVEQNCVYQDIDGKDRKAMHVLGKYEDKVVAYTRLFGPGDYFGESSIGRVVISERYRDRKWGHLLMQRSIGAVAEYLGAGPITISAQQYLTGFYESHGFVQKGQPYLEDGIPHIRMQCVG